MQRDDAVASAPGDDPLDPTGLLSQLAALIADPRGADEVMTDVVTLACERVPGTQEASMTIVGEAGPRTMAATGELATELDERQYEAGWGPCLDAAAAGERLLIRRADRDTRWPEYLGKAVPLGLGSSLSTALPIQQEVSGALNLYSRKPDAFGPESVALATSFAAHAAAVIANARRYTDVTRQAGQLLEAMRSRAVIEQAKGMLMAVHRCTSTEAFDMLVRRSQDEHRKLRVISAEIVEQVSGHPPQE